MSNDVTLKGNDAKNLESESSEFDYVSEFNSLDSGVSRELIVQYIAAGILFPEEIRHAEKILRQLNKKKVELGQRKSGKFI